MISRKKRINALVNLGDYLNDPINSIEIQDLIQLAQSRNAWFTPIHIRQALTSIAHNYLNEENLMPFAESYSESSKPKKIGVVMAGNIPAVGFHDALCVLLSGHTLLAKLSKDDYILMHFLLTKLIEFEPGLQETIQFVEKINDADAYIATGSDNTARYFTYYFARKPHIIRKNRTSVGVLSGTETTDQLSLLGKDMLTYFGLGCRNVSKIYVPEGYDFTCFFESIEPNRTTYSHHNKYFNNYEYNKSILLVNRTEHFDNGFLILTRNPSLVSPLSVIYYEPYSSIEEVRLELAEQEEKIQCVVSDERLIPGALPYGMAQTPGIRDFADRVDTMAFLQSI